MKHHRCNSPKFASLVLLVVTFGLSQAAFAKEKDCCWIDVKTGKRVPTVPQAGINFSGAIDVKSETGHHFTADPGVTIISHDGKTAHNSRTGQQYALEACPSPGKAQPQPTPSTTDKVTDVLKTIGSSVSIGIGGGIGGGGEDRHGHHGEGGHRTAEKVRTGDKSRTTSKKTTTGTGHKTVTAACKCHPCTCAPCTCH
jgi:hypothetical protein